MMSSPRMDEFGETARNAIHLAREAQTEWGRFAPEERGALLRRFRDRLLDRMEEVVAITCAETGKPRFDVVGEIFHCCDLIGYLCRKGPKCLSPGRFGLAFFPFKTAEIQYPP
ncbi:MAG: aldehyde dehydrogenase family protein [Planctomycetota bacterium]